MRKINYINFSISPDQGKGLSFRLPLSYVVFFCGIFLILLAFFIFLIFSYGKLNSQMVLNQALTQENLGLKAYNSKVKELENELREYRLFAHRIAQIAGVQFPLDNDSIKDSSEDKTLFSDNKVAQVKIQKVPIFSTIPTGLPLQGKILKNFSPQGNGKSKAHSGIDISAKIGTEVKATADGVIDFVGQDKKYGNLIVINHENGYKTYYSSCKEIYVKEGDRVKKGEVIALSGRTGRPSPHLHYEIRKDDLPLNPQDYIQ